MNKGERAELLAKIYLIFLRDNRIEIPKIGLIKKVGFEKIEFSSFNKELEEIKNYSDFKLLEFGESLGITKAPASSKADVFINDKGYSLKFHGASLPALINHTPRHLILAVCNRINLDISNIDRAIEEYWNLREDGKIGEDIKISSFYSPFKNPCVKNDLKKLLEYFLFIGTGSKDSDNPAIALIEFSDSFNEITWEVLTPNEAIDRYIDDLTISIRSKGMPEKYFPSSNLERDKRIHPWTRYKNGRYKGSIHIRA